MSIEYTDGRSVSVFIDENKNLAAISYILNPEYKLDPEASMDELWSPPVPPMFPSKTVFELKYPYTLEELTNFIKQGLDAWNKLEPYKGKSKTPEERYYKISGFKNATRGKKSLTLDWDPRPQVDNKVSICLPVKAGRYYLGMEIVFLPNDADYEDYAKAAMELIEMDIEQTLAYKAYKKKLNI